ncbi:MAG TPA: lipopolysaccharide biosynthesis protein [Terriglobales bacterium]|jgi:O-antigen/teichoic acid export membrane protein|nr:lipopolysaccharide biosynthesis protein [Terriglobales bacterium]
MKDLKEKTIRGGSARIVAQAGNFALRIGSVMVLSRLLEPKDFGLLGMVTAFTGILSLFRDFGLSAASVQRATVTEEQTSTLFWINLLVGAILTVAAILLAPAVGTFYREPRLFWVTTIVASGLLFNGAGVQHSAILQRQMRFTALAWIDVISLILSTAIAIVGAKAGYGYWALVAMTVSLPLTTTIGLWLVSRWVPGRPRRGAGIGSMLRFGGTVTVNSLVVYITFNFEKVLLGRFWGAEVLGLYGRAYQLIRIPTDNLNSAVGEVAFSALSRVQNDPPRLKRYFLKGYSLVLGLTIPVTIACALFAQDLIAVLLGPKWHDAAGIFRLLAPTILVFAIVNPLGWLLTSVGMVGRALKMALVMAPVMITGYLVGLRYGPRGVALAYSTLMVLSVVPLIACAVKGTVISVYDMLLAISRPLISGLAAAALILALQIPYGRLLSPLPRLVCGVVILLAVYVGILLYVMGQKLFYLDLLRAFRKRSSPEEEVLVPV